MAVEVQSMHGLGDNIYQRAFIHELCRSEDVYIDTPWPQLYQDLPRVHYLEPRRRLRTQVKNSDRFTGWEAAHKGARVIKPFYNCSSLEKLGLVGSLRDAFKVAPLKWNLPNFPWNGIRGRLAVVRPTTVRKEWNASARNPKSSYITAAAEILQKQGYTVLSIADLQEGHEWLEGAPPPADYTFHQGELKLEALLGLIQEAEVVVGGVGWIVPAMACCPGKLICINGGLGAHNAREVILDDSMDQSRMHFLEPDAFCRCAQMTHRCDKTITDFGGKFHAALDL